MKNGAKFRGSRWILARMAISAGQVCLGSEVSPSTPVLHSIPRNEGPYLLIDRYICLHSIRRIKWLVRRSWRHTESHERTLRSSREGSTPRGTRQRARSVLRRRAREETRRPPKPTGFHRHRVRPPATAGQCVRSRAGSFELQPLPDSGPGQCQCVGSRGWW